MEISVQLLPKDNEKVGFTVMINAGAGDLVTISGDLPETEASLARLRTQAQRRAREILQASLDLGL